MPYQTVWSHVIQTIAEALKGGKNPPIKEVLGNLDPQMLQEAEQSADTGGKAVIGSGMGGETPGFDVTNKTNMNDNYSFQSQMGNNYAPSSGFDTPDKQVESRNAYEQNAFGLDGLRESFMNEGMAPSINANIQAPQGFNIDKLNMALLQEEMRKKNSRPPGNMGWR